MKRVKNYLALFLVTIFIVACGSDDEPNVIKKDLKLDSYTLALKAGEKRSIKITESEGKFTATSSDKAVATVQALSQSIRVTAVAKGEATITVKDEAQTKEVKITVTEKDKELTLDEYTAKVEVGKERVIVVKESQGEFSVKSTDESVVKAVKKDNTVVLTGVKTGTTEVTVTDEKKTVKIEVAVIEQGGNSGNDEEFKVEADKLAGIKAFINRNPVLVKIESGSSDYKAYLEDNSLGNVEIKKTEVKSKDYYTVYVTPLKEGETKLIILDNKSGDKVGIAVTIKKGLTITPSEQQTIAVGEELIIAIDGYGKYSTKDAEGMDKITFEFIENNTKLRIVGKSVGKASFKLVDDETETTKWISVVVIAKKELMLSHYNVSLKDGGTASEVAIESQSENPNYELTYSVQNIVKAEINGDKIVITPVAKGQTVITITDKGFSPAQSKEITVTVQGANDVKVTSRGAVLDLNGNTGSIVLPNNAKSIPSSTSGSTPFAKKSGITRVDFVNLSVIGYAGLFKCKDLEEVHLRKITSIGEYAFNKCMKLKKVYCYMEDPSSVTFVGGAPAKKHFSDIHSDAVLYVPAGKVDAYKNSDFGKYFTKIEEM